jgi:arabinogalactan oligomer/maltooligosaccharide transport system substrate-binding protein
MRFGLLRVGLALLALGAGCTRPRAPGPPLVLWHTFNASETETLSALLPRLGGPPVQAVMVPFPRAFNTLRESLRAGTACPDVFRAEIAQVPALAAQGLLDVRPDGRTALPHSKDGLVLFYDRDRVPTPPATLDAFVRVAASATAGGHYGFFVRGEAYWFLPFLYAEAGDLLSFERREVYIDRLPARAALARYRSLLRYAPPAGAANDYEEQETRFGDGQVAMILNGPWAARELAARPAYAARPERLGVAPLWATPLSGHAFVVPRCARDKAAAWALAARLASREAQALLAEASGMVPADDTVVVRNPLVAAFRAALAHGRARPLHPSMVSIFDDFTPAVQAVLRGDAEPDEALAGVARAWRRLPGMRERP